MRDQGPRRSYSTRPGVASGSAVGNVAPSEAAVDGKVGVLLLNLGGPDTLDDVQPFLYNLFKDPEIIRLPQELQFLQEPLAGFISRSRAPKSREGYEAIGGGSPLRQITEDQARALETALRDRGFDANCYVAMRYWNPYTEEAIEAIKKDGVQRLVVLPLYPQFSISTSGSSLRLLEKLFAEDVLLRNLKHTVIPSWYQRPGYLRAMADLIEAELAKFSDPASAEIFFSAHGVPKSYVEEGDPYKEEMEECVALIIQELRRRGVSNSFTLAYQSRVGPVEWLTPYTDDAINRLGEEGCKAMCAVPISFVSEHIETLEEIDMEYREVAEEAGIKEWQRVPALNVNDTWIQDLAEAVVEALPYTGSVAAKSRGLVPIAGIDTLMEVYDREGLPLPVPDRLFEPGWNKNAEVWNGRIAMMAWVVVILFSGIQMVTGSQ
ncbi:unnamed protein product [Pedinophyceae sp. YPF-701]|nr:unnamed protein product [Pedinophyceae sp. YPF-701]